MLTPRRLLVLAVVAARSSGLRVRLPLRQQTVGCWHLRSSHRLRCHRRWCRVSSRTKFRTSKATIYYPTGRPDRKIEGRRGVMARRNDRRRERCGPVRPARSPPVDPEFTLTPVPTLTPEPCHRLSKRIVLRGVHFDFDKSDIRADPPTLDEAWGVEETRAFASLSGNTDSDKLNWQRAALRAAC
jgi:hypothetical protein